MKTPTLDSRSYVSFLAVVHIAWCAGAQAGDWPQYRGPNHDGTSSENIRINWAEEPPKLLWKVPLNPALSSLTISGSRVFTQARRTVDGGEQEFCIALNAETGAELWATRLGIADYPNGGVGPDDGPRSTPTVEGDRVYVFSSYLRLVCLEAATGKVIWSKDFVAEYGANVIPWENAASPLLVGDLIFVNGNAGPERLFALRKEDGTVVWRKHDDRMTQATPIAATINGTSQVIFFAQSGLVSVAPETGAELWRYPFPYSTSTAASPVVANDVVYCSAAYGRGAGAAQISGDGTSFSARQIWRTNARNQNHWATPVHHGGHVYGIYGQTFVRLGCVDLATGVEKWSREGVGRGGVLLVAGHVMLLTEEGNIVLVKPDPARYSETARFSAVSGKCWNVPAISNGRLYARSTTEAAAYDIAPKSVPKPKLKLTPGFSRGDSGFSLAIANEDGSPLDVSRVAEIDVFAAFDLFAGPAAWIKVTEAPVLSDGLLRLSDPQSDSTPRRFFQIRERQ